MIFLDSQSRATHLALQPAGCRGLNQPCPFPQSFILPVLSARTETSKADAVKTDI
jgi:hypothetical protein